MARRDAPVPDFCDMCGRDLADCDLDYNVRIEVISGRVRRDPGEFQGDLQAEIARLIAVAARKRDVDLMDEVYRRMEFRICPSCQKQYLREPIPRHFGRKHP